MVRKNTCQGPARAIPAYLEGCPRFPYAASFAFTRTTVAAVHTPAPAGVGKPSAVSLAARARSDSEPLRSSRVMIVAGVCCAGAGVGYRGADLDTFKPPFRMYGNPGSARSLKRVGPALA